MPPTETQPDFTVQNEFTIYILRPQSERAREWVEEHLPEDRMTFGDGVVIEHRYIEAIVWGIRNDGLTVQEES